MFFKAKAKNTEVTPTVKRRDKSRQNSKILHLLIYGMKTSALVRRKVLLVERI